MAAIDRRTEVDSCRTKVILIKVDLFPENKAVLFHRADNLNEVLEVLFEVIFGLPLLARPEVLKPDNLRHVIPIMKVQVST